MDEMRYISAPEGFVVVTVRGIRGRIWEGEGIGGGGRGGRGIMARGRDSGAEIRGRVRGCFAVKGSV